MALCVTLRANFSARNDLRKMIVMRFKTTDVAAGTFFF